MKHLLCTAARSPFLHCSVERLRCDTFMFGRSCKPTRHLLIGSIGPGLGIQRDAIAAAFAPLGCTDVHVPQLADRKACYVFASFVSQSAAAHALAALHEQPCSGLGGRVLTAKYAAEKRKGKVSQLTVSNGSIARQSCCPDVYRKQAAQRA